MRIAFYAPLKSPMHATPSGDRRVAALLIQALERAGHRVAVASEFSSLDMVGDAARQAALGAQGRDRARQLTERWQSAGASERPELWFTYHLYYKAPDWLGPAVSASLRIPYVIAEPAFAPKRALGPWASGHEAVRAAIGQASLAISPSRDDLDCLRPLVSSADRLVHLPPFLDAAALAEARAHRGRWRAALASAHRLDPQRPWLVVAAMMRPGDKLASYRELAEALALLQDLSWQLLVAGDGPARGEAERALERAAPGRVRFLGALASEALAGAYAAGDLYIWPAVNEAYGMAMLEAQAAGLPVVSSDLRGVPDVVRHGDTGLLATPGDPRALAAQARRLLEDPQARSAMGERAAAWVARERGIDVAAGVLDRLLEDCLARARAA